MKDFFVTWLIAAVIIFVFIFFGGAVIFENIWAWIIFISFIIALIISLYMHCETKMEKMETRIKELEEKIENKEEKEI